MNFETKLSICIPTFNNSRGLDEILLILSKQANDFGLMDRIEVCISDNSQYGLNERMIAYNKSNLDIVINYSQNESNIGYDRNVDRVLKMATGDFCWLLSDNENISDDALRNIYQVVSAYPQVGHILICQSDSRVDVSRRFESLSAAMEFLWPWIPGGLISRNIFARNLLPKDLTKYYGNDWIHMSLAIEIGRTNPVVCIGELLSGTESEVCLWAKNGQTFRTYMNLLNIMRNLPHEYDQKIKSRIVGAMQKRVPREILSSKLYGLTNTLSVRQEIRKQLERRSALKFLSLVALATPATLIKHAKKFKNYFGY